MTSNNLNSLGNEIREIEQRFKQEIEPVRSDLWHFCLKLTRSPWEAEDLVQDTLLRSLGVLAKIHQPVNTKAYIFKVAANLWIDQKRRQRFTIEQMDENYLQDNSAGMDFQLIDDLDFLIDRLTPLQYVTLILSEAFQFKAKETALIAGTSENAVYANLSRARSILRDNKPVRSKDKGKPEDLVPHEPLNVLLEGFRKKDPEMIASVLSRDVSVEITHAGLEMGLEETRKNSLRDWKEIADTQNVIEAKYKKLWGCPVVIEMEEKQDGRSYLNNIHFVETFEGEIIYWRFYCFSWDLMKLAAEELGVEMNAQYFYHIY
ncbi:sigma-70 family RNA polymerase sigma factor [Bacillus salacetis]|uniref:RNA polymerase sigma factor n=1 Tax=Bacillus salacetis TaxID=2315464 RepID=A0A3A1QVJ6_9BACI|nr:RNA polymerase sigma factor [Bacillus salacetis]RIW32002.1 sigma-70 family RNA polymerase sigma factor [Bacillus salacetis]